MRRFVILCSVLLVLLTGCAGLSDEPPIIRTAAVPTVTPSPAPDLGRPPAPVSILRGATIFGSAQGCQACHGAGGKGDGQTAASLTCKIPDMTNPETARPNTLSAWFAITTNGNGQTQGCLMPPWKTRLTEQQRWDVTAFMYSLHYTPTILQTGKQLWADNCAACHGDKGNGDGPKAKDSPRPVTALSDSQYMITHSDNDMFTAVTKGVGSIMPAFTQLTDDQRWSVVAYARSLSWAETINPAGAQKLTYTTDPNIIQVQTARMLLEYSNGLLVVQQGFAFVNSSTTDTYQNPDGTSLRVTLPAGAANVTMDADMRSLYTLQDGPTPVLVGNRAIGPGEQRSLIVTYMLPFQTPLSFKQTLLYDVQSVSVFLSEQTGLAVSDRSFAVGQPIPLQDANGQTVNYRQYANEGGILAGLPIQFTLDKVDQITAQENAMRRNTLAAVFTASLIAFALVAFGVYRISRTS